MSDDDKEIAKLIGGIEKKVRALPAKTRIALFSGLSDCPKCGSALQTGAVRRDCGYVAEKN